MLTRARSNFQANWTAIILAVISIIQGLAFNNLADRLQAIIHYTLVTHDLVPAAHFLFAFAVLLRIFQTYVTAALDYDEWVTSFPDVLIIFVLGLIEYFVFSSLNVPGFSVVTFHMRVSIVSVLAAIGYVRAYAALKEPMFATYRAYRKERRLQAVNIGGAVAVQGLSLIVILSRPLPNGDYVAIGILAAAILACNIGYSLKVTFAPGFASELVAPKAVTPVALATEPAAASRSLMGSLVVRPARRQDALALARMMTGHFGYIYSATFDTSERMTETILLSLLRAAGGRIPDFGYRSFLIAAAAQAENECSGGNARESGRDDANEALGLIKLTFAQTSLASKIYWIFIPAILIYHLGLTGLLRTWRNWRVLSDTVPYVGSEDCYVQYIAVKDGLQGRGIGARLMESAREAAEANGKTRVTLDVREANRTARRFFSREGFVENQVVPRRSDALMAKGPTIKMSCVLDGQA